MIRRAWAGAVTRRARAGAVTAPHRHERGSASVWLLAVGLVLLAAALAGVTIGAAHLARHQAQSAADLGALAGAARALAGADVACGRAEEIVSANRARLTSCALEGLELTITVEVDPAPVVPGDRPATATARAGPARTTSFPASPG